MRYVAVTACPTGIAHTYMAAEKLSEAAELSGDSIKVETQGSIGSENVLTEADITEADGVIIAADLDINLDRFAGKRVLVTSVADGISRPGKLMEDVLEADIVGASAPAQSAAGAPEQGTSGSAGRFGGVYRALMNGVTHMIPFVVTGGLLIAISLSLGGEASEAGLAIPAGTFWDKVFQIGVLSFTLMIPILSGYIAFAIADRPGLVPG
ncbi:MAG: fructose PTS transporter subunit IIB, partial [Actinomycetota bacterium]